MRVFANLRASAIAMITILALVLVPACGSLCAAMNHCSASTDSAEADTCHHANMSAQSDSGVLSSPVSCGQQAPLMAILAATDSSIQLQSVSAASAVVSIDASNHAFTLENRVHEFPSKDSPQQRVPLESLSVLRI